MAVLKNTVISVLNVGRYLREFAIKWKVVIFGYLVR